MNQVKPAKHLTTEVKKCIMWPHVSPCSAILYSTVYNYDLIITKAGNDVIFHAVTDSITAILCNRHFAKFYMVTELWNQSTFLCTCGMLWNCGIDAHSANLNY